MQCTSSVFRELTKARTRPSIEEGEAATAADELNGAVPPSRPPVACEGRDTKGTVSAVAAPSCAVQAIREHHMASRAVDDDGDRDEVAAVVAATTASALLVPLGPILPSVPSSFLKSAEGEGTGIAAEVTTRLNESPA
jgi:hypothetical protein